MDGDGGWKKTLRNFGVEAKRAAERTTAQAMSKMGLSAKISEMDPQFEQGYENYSAQTAALKSLRDATNAAIDAVARNAAAGAALASALHKALGAASTAARATEAHVTSQRNIADGALRRAERRLHSKIETPVEEELARSREMAAAVDQRRKISTDYRRYRARVDDFAGADLTEDSVKADDKLRELQTLSEAINDQINASLPRRAALIDRCAAQVAEILRDFHVEAASALDSAVVAATEIGEQKPATVMPNAAGDMFARPPEAEATRPPYHPKAQPSIWDAEEEQKERLPRRARSAYANVPAGASIWDEDESSPLQKPVSNASQAPSQTNESRRPSGRSSDLYTANTNNVPEPLRRRGDSSGYPSGGVGQRETLRRESSESSSYPSSGNGQKTSLYPSRRAPTTRSRQPLKTDMPRSASRDSGLGGKSEAKFSTDILGSFGGTTGTTTSTENASKPPRQRKSASGATASSSLDDLLNLGGSNGNGGGGSSRPRPGVPDGDLLGVFVSRPARSASRTARSPPTKSPPTSQRAAPTNGGSATNPQREELKRKNEAEIRARAAEKLAAVRERENAKAAEQEKKDDARAGAERRVSQWTGHGARRGNLRALLASLDTVLYTGHTWKAVSMDVLKVAPKVKLHYRKAILQVHPDKIGPKKLAPDQQMLAELIFDELQNGYEVFVAEQEGRAPPAGSVGPKKAPNSGASGAPGFGTGGMYSGMGRGMGGMGGMNNMGGRGMAGMGRGMSGMGMGGRGGYGNMYAQANGRAPFGAGRAYGMGMNQQQRR